MTEEGEEKEEQYYLLTAIQNSVFRIE